MEEELPLLPKALDLLLLKRSLRESLELPLAEEVLGLSLILLGTALLGSSLMLRLALGPAIEPEMEGVDLAPAAELGPALVLRLDETPDLLEVVLELAAATRLGRLLEKLLLLAVDRPLEGLELAGPVLGEKTLLVPVVLLGIVEKLVVEMNFVDRASRYVDNKNVRAPPPTHTSSSKCTTPTT